MGTKSNPRPNDCYVKACADEPLFTLLARDPSAPDLVRRWAEERESDIANGLRPDSDADRVRDARNLADEMEMWREAADGKWREQATGAVPDSFVSREGAATYIERYAERMAAGPALKEFSGPINRNREEPAVAADIRKHLRAVVAAIRSGVDQPEADWPLAEQGEED